jgi:glyoxylase-like metal-dependent hydrolase (beta-lactamase superfamily II)
MAVQLELDEAALAEHRDAGAGLRELRPDVAYLRTAIVNVIFVGDPAVLHEGWVLVDTGVAGFHAQILDAALHRFGTARPAAIVLTHGHFDHVGSLQQLSTHWNVPIYCHPEEVPYLDGTRSYPPPDAAADGGIMPKLSPFFPREPVDVSDRLFELATSGVVQPLPRWRWVHTPGHTPGHISLWREDDKTLIAGDAVITTGQESAFEVLVQKPEMHGPPRYFTPDWTASAQSVRTLAGLAPDLLVAGHGQPLAGAPLRRALETLADNFEAIAPPARLRAEPRPAPLEASPR